MQETKGRKGFFTTERISQSRARVLPSRDRMERRLTEQVKNTGGKNKGQWGRKKDSNQLKNSKKRGKGLKFIGGEGPLGWGGGWCEPTLKETGYGRDGESGLPQAILTSKIPSDKRKDSINCVQTDQEGLIGGNQPYIRGRKKGEKNAKGRVSLLLRQKSYGKSDLVGTEMAKT